MARRCLLHPLKFHRKHYVAFIDTYVSDDLYQAMPACKLHRCPFSNTRTKALGYSMSLGDSNSLAHNR